MPEPCNPHFYWWSKLLKDYQCDCGMTRAIEEWKELTGE
jgi:hypothetical protein